MTDFNKAFITGDRMMHPLYPGWVMMEMLKARDKGRTIVTGTNDGGIEMLVRLIAESTGVEIQIVEQSALDVPDNPGHWVDWDKRHQSLSDDTEFVGVHVDPTTCREFWSAEKVLPEERVRYVTPLDFFDVSTLAD